MNVTIDSVDLEKLLQVLYVNCAVQTAMDYAITEAAAGLVDHIRGTLRPNARKATPHSRRSCNSVEPLALLAEFTRRK